MKSPIKSPSECLPDTSSPVKNSKIKSSATIYRDPWGIPHIQADNLYDAFFAQGFATAQDRLWQMDFDRLRCLGRSAEYLGTSAIEEDTLMRRRGFERVSRADYDICNKDAKLAIDAYTDGVNAFIESDNPLPFEYSLLETTPDAWQPWHCIAVYKVRNSAEGSFQAKLWRSNLAAKIGAERTAQLSPGYQKGMYITVPPGTTYQGNVLNAIEELRKIVSATTALREIDGGSNGWSVSGKLTSSGLPMVGGDSHRGLEIPNVYYQVHIATNDFDILGHSIPGMPLVMHFAHNQHVAWGMTHGGVDTQDLFVEKIRRNNNTIEYLFRGEWLQAESYTEQLNVRGTDPIQIEVVRTHHGPIIAGDIDKGCGIALADPGSNDATPWVDAALNAMKSKNADELEKALSEWTDRVNNYPYADKHGNFGYALKGRIPIRNSINGWGPVEGWTGEHEWNGYIPDEELPRSRNPEIGWAVTCNQRVVDDEYPYFLTTTFGPDYRARRIISHIQHAISNNTKITLDDMAKFHADTISIPALAIINRVKNLQPSRYINPNTTAVINALATWNGNLDTHSTAATIYSTLNDQIDLGLIQRCYDIDPKQFNHNPEIDAFQLLKRQVKPAFITALANDTNANTFLKDGESVDDFLLDMIAKVAENIQLAPNGEIDIQNWEQAHITKQIHPLSVVFPQYAQHLDAPAVGTAGDGDVPFATTSKPIMNHKTGSGPVNRYLHDPSNWSNGKWITPLGASGNSSSPHFSDQQTMWAKVQYIPQLFNWNQIKQHAKTTQHMHK